MTYPGIGARTYLLSGIALAAFVAFLVLTLLRLGDIGRDLNQDVGEDLMWEIAQAQAEALRLNDAVLRWEAGGARPEAAAPILRQYDLALSRLELWTGGASRRKLAELGMGDTIARHRAALLALEPALRAELSQGRHASADVEAVVRPLATSMREAANRHVTAQRARAGALRDRYRRTLYDIIGSLIGIMASGGFLAFRLFASLRATTRVQRSLQRERDFSELLLGSSGEGIAAFDRNLRCTLWNPGMAQLLGLPAEAAVGRSVREIPILADGPRVEDALRRTLEGHDVFLPDHPGVQLGQRLNRYLEAACFPLRQGGEVVGGIAFLRDVTARNQAQRELARHRDQLEQLVQERTGDLQRTQRQLTSAINTAPDGFAAFAPDGRLVLANEYIRTLFADEPALFDEGARLDTILAALARRAPLAMEAEAAGTGGELMSRELCLSPALWLHITVRRMAGGGTVMRMADITAYKLAALTLENALQRERSLNDFYRSFVSMVSHQFRTPLAIIDSGVQRIMRRGAEMTPAEIAERAEKIRSATGRLTRLVEGTLNASRLDAGQIDMKPRACDFGALVAEACERQRELAPGRRIETDLDGLPPAVRCDPILIEQVVSNLLSNALKYSPEHEPIEVRAWAETDVIRFSVRDRGVGVPADDVPHLFERFFRARTAAGIDGTGIGLNLARAIAHMHGGEIAVETKEGAGSTFTLSLPLVAPLQRHN